jgi:hypothetical protein
MLLDSSLDRVKQVVDVSDKLEPISFGSEVEDRFSAVNRASDSKGKLCSLRCNSPGLHLLPQSRRDVQV